MQLRAANVNANDADVHEWLQPLATLVLGTTCFESVVAVPESHRTKRGACRKTENSFGETRCSSLGGDPPSPTRCWEMDCRRGALLGGHKGNGQVIPDSGRLGATLAHSAMIRFRCTGIAPDSLLFLARPTHFPRAPVRMSTARFHVPSTPFTVRCTAARVFQQSQNVAAWRDSLHVLKLLARGSCGTGSTLQTSGSTNVHRPTLMNRPVGLMWL